MAETPDYKTTVRLPQTDFPMKGDLPKREPQIIASWDEKKIYQRMVERNRGKKKFTLPDGPPYANGSLHMGHALNKNLKDFIIKYKNMKGFEAQFVPGWDCHGLPIEHKVMKDLSEKKKTATDAEILALCRAEAAKWVAHQGEQFKRLGVLADWKNPYMTMSKDYEAEEVREFARMFKKGLIYRGEKPVYWNWTLKTALADAEVEYHDHKSPSIYVKFPVKDAATLAKLGSPKGPVSIVIWTTTPWTLPANLGICLNEEFAYGVYALENEFIVIAEGLKESVEKDCAVELRKVGSVKGKDLDLGKARHPWIDRDALIMLGDHVTLEGGTGCVHTAPGHGVDDFRVGQKYQIGVLCPVDDGGKFTEDVPEWAGQNIFKANPLIIEKLKGLGLLMAHKDITHSYPHCWRSKTPLIFRTTPQWFLGLDLEESQIRQKTLAAMNDVKFFPAWGEARFRSMMEGRPDWCVSRQRIWGVPIPILFCKATGEPLAETDVMDRIADVIEKGGIEAFWLTSADELAGTGHVKGKFGSEGFKHGRDILDVWFDSGVCHAAVQRKRGMDLPADIYLEGSDQHRGWFNTSMLSSMATNGVPPFRALVTHGFLTDATGRKMSKSLGNTIDPMDVTNQSGTEIIRLWASSEDYGQDVSCGKESLTRVTETYRRLRNTMKYLLGSLHDFDHTKDMVPVEKMTAIDRWALHELNDLVVRVTDSYDRYEFHRVYHSLNVFFTVFLSATYLDILKDRLYTWRADGVPRRSSQTVIFHLTDTLIRLMAPVLTFLAEESYSHFKGRKEDSVFLVDFPVARPEWENPSLKAHYDEVLKVRTETQKVLEQLRAEKTIGASLEAAVVITAADATLEHLKRCENLRELLIVSKVELREGALNISASKAAGEKCVRCWTYSESLGQNQDLPGICPKCVEALT